MRSKIDFIETIYFTLDLCFFFFFFSFSIVRHNLSESDDVPPSPMSPLAPPLPEGAVVASEKRMVIVKHPLRSLDSSHSRLNSLEIELEPRNKVYAKVIAISILCPRTYYVPIYS